MGRCSWQRKPATHRKLDQEALRMAGTRPDSLTPAFIWQTFWGQRGSSAGKSVL